MPSLDWNRATWDREHAWDAAGDEWSVAWGSSAAQWHWCLRPRLHRHLPAGRIVEIGPGHGRWTQFLVEECAQLHVVDLSPACIEACRARFASNPKLSYAVTGGSSLPGVADGSVDLVFSFDSLVHAELDVIRGYLRELARALKPNGVAFIHHSNLGQYGYFRGMRWLEGKFAGTPALRAAAEPSPEPAPAPASLGARLARIAVRTGLVDRTHMRALSVSADRVRAEATACGLACLSQEVFPWGASRRTIDCISVLAHAASAEAPCRRTVNREFMKEAERVRALGELYR